MPNLSGDRTWCSLASVNANQWAVATRSTDGPAHQLGPWSRDTTPVDAILNGIEVAVARSSQSRAGLSAEDLRRPGQLRRVGLDRLRHWRLDCLADNAALLITELATNALLHGSGTEFALRMIHTAGELRIEVYDGSPARPYERAAGPDDESGRGMAIVAAIAHTWGTSGPTTWCTLTVPTAGKAQ
ncbi:ATP-binding protein [Streptomyces lunaelactis]|uniref:ATP-binding protein n=2 Tax=Streptomyces lunaelactis TaxID=1535768 RepID=UPI00158526DB|nr:ATP-binding protein [Streptomyces lunaelactis]NUK12541.1 ATP-binding protein [Streptomyces lunaelactis]NUK37426.1 ATP-binding protein [Streptomyces lunaelactis]NUK45990.1 ATP-binding protein [Streptomyces lunaelactis]NUK60509.1 ATP-binding protein [Streptomyces lunaelactis]NUK95768.1 ATP-binding protein [Streptomyces lunaelactis]